MQIKLTNIKNIDLFNSENMNTFTDFCLENTTGYQGWCYDGSVCEINAESFANSEVFNQYGDVSLS